MQEKLKRESGEVKIICALQRLSISFGCADAALIVSKDPDLADAAATAWATPSSPRGRLNECFKCD